MTPIQHHDNVAAAISATSLTAVLAVIARRYRDTNRTITADILADAIAALADNNAR